MSEKRYYRGLSMRAFRAWALRRFPFCQWCRAPLTRATATADHLVPVSDNGSDHLGNLCLSCKGCNNGRGNRPAARRPPHGPSDWQAEWDREHPPTTRAPHRSGPHRLWAWPPKGKGLAAGVYRSGPGGVRGPAGRDPQGGELAGGPVPYPAPVRRQANLEGGAAWLGAVGAAARGVVGDAAAGTSPREVPLVGTHPPTRDGGGGCRIRRPAVRRGPACRRGTGGSREVGCGTPPGVSRRRGLHRTPLASRPLKSLGRLDNPRPL